MPTYISLLRGINVGGHNKLPMEELRKMLEALGCRQVQTYIQSGNVVYEAVKSSPAVLSMKIEKKILAEFGFEVPVVTRTPEEVARAIEQNPFVAQSKNEPAKVHIAFLTGVPQPDAVKKLEALSNKKEKVRCAGKEVYLYYTDGMGQAKLTGSVIERVLGVAATARNWNTVNKLLALST